MYKHEKHSKTTVKTVFCALFGVLFVVFFLLASLSGVFNRYLLNNEHFLDNVANEKYMSDVNRFIDESITEEAVYYGFDPDKMIACVDRQKVRELSHDYILVLCDFFDGKGELEVIHYPAEDFYPPIHEHYVALGDIDEEGDMLIAEDFAKQVDNNINTLVNLDIITNLFKGRTANYIRKFSSFYPLFVIGSVLLLVGFMLLTQGRIFKRFYHLSVLTFVASSLFALPVTALKIFDLPSKIVLLDSPLKTLVDRMLYTSIDGTFRSSIVIAVMTLAALLVFSFLYARETVIREERHRHHHHHSKYHGEHHHYHRHHHYENENPVLFYDDPDAETKKPEE